MTFISLQWRRYDVTDFRLGLRQYDVMTVFLSFILVFLGMVNSFVSYFFRLF